MSGNYVLQALVTISLVFGILSMGVHCQASVKGKKTEGKKPLNLPPLPFEPSSLEPFISSQTMSFHFGKHHAAYVEKANELLAKSPLEGKPVEEILRETDGNSEQKAIFNNVAQAWNHAFFWQCLKPNGGGKPEGILAKRITESFGGFEAFKEEFLKSGKAVFGSGWVWLVEEEGTLKILATQNAETPFGTKRKPIFVIDVWEHAYYLDYQNQRAEYLKKVLENLANWEFAASNL